MDFLSHSRGLTRLWGSLMSDYEVVVSNFLRSEGWTYSHFAQVAREADINLAFNCAVGKGKRRQEQQDEVVQIIIETAKDQWLSADRPDYKFTRLENEIIGKENRDSDSEEEQSEDEGASPSKISQALLVDQLLAPGKHYTSANGTSDEEDYDPLSDEEDESMNMEYEEPKAGPSKPERRCLKSSDLVITKRQLGGFYLTYSLYHKQPYRGLHRIRVDSEDIRAIHRFQAKVATLTPKIREQFDLLLKRLRLSFAFDSVGFTYRYGLDHGTRSYLNYSRHETVGLIKMDKDVQDTLSQCQDVQVGQKKYQKYFQQKRVVLHESLHVGLQKALANVNELPSNVPDDSLAEYELVPNLRSTVGVGPMVEAASKIKMLGQQPLFTPANMLGHEQVDRVFMKEAYKRMKRMKTKQEKVEKAKQIPSLSGYSTPNPDAKKANPYVREGGIFGRKKFQDEDDEGNPLEKTDLRRKKERAQTSGNLWNYISGVEFNTGRQPPPPPVPGSEPVGTEPVGTVGGLLAIEAPPPQTPQPAEKPGSPPALANGGINRGDMLPGRRGKAIAVKPTVKPAIAIQPKAQEIQGSGSDDDEDDDDDVPDDEDVAMESDADVGRGNGIPSNTAIIAMSNDKPNDMEFEIVIHGGDDGDEEDDDESVEMIPIVDLAEEDEADEEGFVDGDDEDQGYDTPNNSFALEEENVYVQSQQVEPAIIYDMDMSDNQVNLDGQPIDAVYYIEGQDVLLDMLNNSG